MSVCSSGFEPNLDLKASHMDEFTVGYQRQIGRLFGVSARFISRNWGNLIDDVRTFDAEGNIEREVLNYDAAERTYRGVQLTAEKRFSDNWNAQASYTFSRTRGNHFPTDLAIGCRSKCGGMTGRLLNDHLPRLTSNSSGTTSSSRCPTAEVTTSSSLSK